MYACMHLVQSLGHFKGYNTSLNHPSTLNHNQNRLCIPTDMVNVINAYKMRLNSSVTQLCIMQHCHHIQLRSVVLLVLMLGSTPFTITITADQLLMNNQKKLHT